jgi:dTMP kinase
VQRGVLITFEGVEGCGKSTQAELLQRSLRERGVQVLLTREPGGTTLGEQVRALLLSPASAPVPLAELFLLEAARAHLVATVIVPALARGEVVLSDRFSDSSLAYQGSARGLEWDVVRRLNAIACGELRPARTVILQVPLELALSRARSRIATTAANRRFEDEAEPFHRLVAAGFQRLAREEPERVRLVDGSGSPESVHERVLAELAEVLP